MGLWSEQQSFSTNQSDQADWACEKVTNDASQFIITHQGKRYPIRWELIGDHNMANAVAATPLVTQM